VDHIKKWLKTKRSKEEFTTEQQEIYDSLADRPAFQRSFKARFLEPFMAYYQEGDEIWYFKSPKEDWDRLMGRAGNAIIRNGECVYYQVTELN
jgi:hypothetical protein